MLFEIDESVSELLAGELSGQDHQAIVYLAIAAAEGNHRITGRRKVLQQLAETPGMTDRQKAAFIRAAGKVTEEGMLPRRLNVLGRVIASTDTRPSAIINGSQRVITFPLRWFDLTAKIQPVILLAENLSDVKVYQTIGEAGSVLASLGYVFHSISPRHGGGSTIGQVLRGIAQSDLICLCLVDSDKACPQSIEGDTARSVAQFRNVQTYPLIEVLLTLGRDLENALPDSFYKITYSAGSQHESMAQTLLELSLQGERDIRRHLDVKKGLVLRDVFGFTAGSPEVGFWQTGLTILLGIRGINITSFPCNNKGVCTKTKRTECECQIVSGNAANILEDFTAANQGTDRFTLGQRLDASVRDEWIALGSIIASWCCGDSRLRI